MTGSPFSLRAEPFDQKIVDFTHQYNVEESVILIQLNNGYKTADYFIFDIFDRMSLILFFTIFVIIIALIIFIDDNYILNNRSLFDKINSLCIQLWSNLVDQGKFIRFLDKCLVHFLLFRNNNK